VDQREVLRACQAFNLERATLQARGGAGDQAALRSGTSSDFHGFRAYAPGDDLRRVDWAVYARTRELVLRLYREEIHPQLEVLLDVSRSMALEDGRKPALARELAAFAWHSARLQGSAARILAFGEQMQTLAEPTEPPPYAAGCCLFEQPARYAQHLRPGSLRVLISDCMSEHAPERALRELAASAGRLVVLITWGPWEANPSAAGATSLIDAENGAELLGALSDSTLARYRQRLARLAELLQRACHAAGALCVNVRCDETLTQVLRRDLLPAGVVRPA
jgi:uncharacterized protein (DUF58 family)